MVELTNQLEKHTAIKCNLELFSEYAKLTGDHEEIAIKSFNTKMATLLDAQQLEPFYDTTKDEILNKMATFQERDSGWALIGILHLELNVNAYKPFKGSSYIPLPKKLAKRHACINLRNDDIYCFKWAIISAMCPTVRGTAFRTSAYPVDDITANIILLEEYNIKLDFSGLDFPLKVYDVGIFEEHNENISVNVFGLEGDDIVGPFYCTKAEKNKHINLLMIQDYADNCHYVWIKHISRLVRSQLTKSGRKIFICNCCLAYFASNEQLCVHKNECSKIVSIMPSPDNCTLKFEKYERGLKVPFAVFADFECILQDIDTCLPCPKTSSTTDVQQHVPFAFAYYVKCSHDSTLDKLKVYRGEDAAKKFVQYLVEDVKDIYHNVIMKPKPMSPLTDEEKQIQENSTECHICKKALGEVRVADHDHFTSIYRGPAHKECNLRFRVPKFVPVYFHNFSGYDCHLFVKALNEVDGPIDLIPLNKELYVSLSKRIFVSDEKTIELRFLDSARFMPSSLEKLANNLATKDFNTTRAYYTDNKKFQLVTRKGVLPYEYLNSLKRLDEPVLPAKTAFNNKLTNSVCSDTDYDHAVQVWETFDCKQLWDYVKIYLVTDVLLLTDIFTNFRDVCLKIYGLDCCHYYTTPGVTLDAALKCLGVELELLTDYNMHSFIKRGIRGGITQCSHRHSVANNKYMDEYDSNKPSTYLMYLDVNNLYGWAMSQPLPYGGFKWVENIECIDVINLKDDSPIGYVFEVDLEIPLSLHSAHSDLPFCAESKCPPNSKFSKLIPDFAPKTKYIIHYRNLQQCLKHGLKLVKIHRALQFNQSCWLKKYIQLNTHYRTLAKNEFEKNFFKLMNNALFGKTIEDVCKRRDVRIATEWDNCTRRLGARALIAKPNFHSATQFTSDMVAIQLNRIKTFYNKPIYLGFSILEISKWLMYNFHYEYMRPKYKENLLLNYMDTDSFIYTITTDDFYSDIREDVNTHFDTSDYSSDNPYNLPLVNKKVVGLMKDENCGRIMREFIGLRSKMYSIDVIGSKVVKKAKGVKQTAVHDLSLSNYRDCLYKKRIIYKHMLTFKSKVHEIYTQNLNKIALSYSDDKRFIREDGISTYAWGDHRIKDEAAHL